MLKLSEFQARRPLAVSLALLAVGAAAGGCGDASSSSTAAPATTGQAAAADVPFTGPESKLPSAYPEPARKQGFTYTVGFLSPNASIGFLGQIQRAAVAETQRLGGKVIAKDAGFDPGKQVSQFQDLLAQRVDAIISYPVVPQTLGPAVRQAQQQKVPVVTQDTPPDPGAPLLPGYATEVLQARDRADYEIAKALARQAPGSTYALLGNAQPVPLLQFAIQRARYWADRFGLKFVGRVDQTTDTADAAQKAMTSILSQHPDVDNVITYTDNSAAAAAQVARASGKADIRVAGVGGDATAFKLIKAGILWGTYAQNAAEIGRQMAIAAYANVTGQGDRLPKKITVAGGQLVTKDNVDSVKPSTPA